MATGVDTSGFAKKADLAHLKSDVDKLDLDKLKNVPSNLSNLKSKVDKLVSVPVNLSKLSDVVKNDFIKKDYIILSSKIPGITNLGSNTTLNAKTNEVKSEIPCITNISTNTAPTAVESKIPNASNVVNKADYNTKINEIENKITTDHDHDKYIITKTFNKFTSENVCARLAQANLASKSDVANFVKKTDFDNKLQNLNKNVTSNKAKHVLVEKELNEHVEHES